LEQIRDDLALVFDDHVQDDAGHVLKREWFTDFLDSHFTLPQSVLYCTCRRETCGW
jgi:hypothetical protein